MTTLTITKIGNSEGVILPKEVLAKLHVSKGDKIFLTETSDGYQVHSYDPALAKEMEVAEDIMRVSEAPVEEQPKRSRSAG